MSFEDEHGLGEKKKGVLKKYTGKGGPVPALKNGWANMPNAQEAADSVKSFPKPKQPVSVPDKMFFEKGLPFPKPKQTIPNKLKVKVKQQKTLPPAGGGWNGYRNQGLV